MTYKIMKIIERPVYSKRIKPFIGFFEEKGNASGRDPV